MLRFTGQSSASTRCGPPPCSTRNAPQISPAGTQEPPVRITPDPIRPGQESVWSYPRPAIAEPTTRHLRIIHRGVTIAETSRAIRTLETSHPPSYYFPPEDIAPGLLRPSRRSSFCEWKGVAAYFDVEVAGETLRDVAWSYPNPSPAFAALQGHIAFYAAPFDACTVDGAQVTPQPGPFYGGWISPFEAGPFKGPPAPPTGNPRQPSRSRRGPRGAASPPLP